MNRDSKNQRTITLFAFAVSILIGIIYHIVFSPSIVEFRTIMTVDSDLYNAKIEQLPIAGKTIASGQYFFSPNLESKADTLKEEGIRRFEMREYYVSNTNKVEARKSYYSAQNLAIPEIIYDEKFGERKPIGRALGIALCGITLTLLFSFIQRFIRSRQKEHKE